MVATIKENLDAVIGLCGKYKVQTLEIFGSAMDERRFDESGSDLDFLVEFLPMEPTAHARSYFSLLEELKELFKRSIDLVESKAIKNPYFLEAVNKEREQIYAA
jgi:hypothetical protein